MNGVFLVVLCMSILFEAIQRFIEPQTVSNPRLILIVGSCGLASNILGLLLLHEHESPAATAGDEEHDTTSRMTNQENSALGTQNGNIAKMKRASTLTSVAVHPSTFRAEIIAATQPEQHVDDRADAVNETTLLLNGQRSSAVPVGNAARSSLHETHIHQRPDQKQAHQGRGDLNMAGVLLHVVGDAIGNVGVIASALFIWLTDYRWRYYADPTASVIIAAIILHTAIPLCKSASSILLQGVPEGVDIDGIKSDITSLPEVVGCHELHVWQLSDSQIVGTVHMEIDESIIKEGSGKYKQVLSTVKACLGAHGILSATIQVDLIRNP